MRTEFRILMIYACLVNGYWPMQFTKKQQTSELWIKQEPTSGWHKLNRYNQTTRRERKKYKNPNLFGMHHLQLEKCKDNLIL